MQLLARVAVMALVSAAVLALSGMEGALADDPQPTGAGTEASWRAPRVDPPRGAGGQVLRVDTAGVGQPGGPRSAWEAVTQGLEACRAKGPCTLVLPKGQYTLDDPGILDRAGAALQLNGLTDVVIDGQGSDLVFHYIREGFSFSGCHRVLLRNFTVDWDVRLASGGVVVKLPGGKLGIKLTDPYQYGADTPFAAVTEYDLKAMRWKQNPAEVYSPTDVKMVEPGVFTSPSFTAFRVGAEVCVRHYVYEAHGFDFSGAGNSDISFENITLYGAPGHAWVGYGCDRGVSLKGCRIERKPGTDRLVSATADGAHFGNMEGDIIVSDCDFSYQGDDAINIHGVWSTVRSQLAKRTLSLTSRWAWAVSFAPGEELMLARSANLAEYYRTKVVSCTVDPATALFTVQVANDLPTDVRAGDYVANTSRASSNFAITGNYFHDHRARGILLQAGDGLVENNRISRVMAAAVQMTTDCNYWQEGFGCHDVVVRGNVFESDNYATWERHSTGRNMACVNVVVDTPTGLGDYPVHRNITIENNDIVDTPGLAILVSSAQGVRVLNNRIVDSNTQGWNGTGTGIKAQAKGAIMVTRADTVEVRGNTISSTKKVYDAGVYVDAATTKNVAVDPAALRTGK